MFRSFKKQKGWTQSNWMFRRKTFSWIGALAAGFALKCCYRSNTLSFHSTTNHFSNSFRRTSPPRRETSLRRSRRKKKLFWPAKREVVVPATLLRCAVDGIGDYVAFVSKYFFQESILQTNTHTDRQTDRQTQLLALVRTHFFRFNVSLRRTRPFKLSADAAEHNRIQ